MAVKTVWCRNSKTGLEAYISTEALESGVFADWHEVADTNPEETM